MALDETISNGQAGHISDHQVLAKRANMVVTPEDYGAVGDGTTDDWGAFNSMMAAIAGQHATVNLSSQKTYKLNQPWDIDAPILVNGNMARLFFAPGSHGIIAHRSGTSPRGTASGYWYVRDLELYSEPSAWSAQNWTNNFRTVTDAVTTVGSATVTSATGAFRRRDMGMKFVTANAPDADQALTVSQTNGSTIVTWNGSTGYGFQQCDIGKTVTGSGIPASTTITAIYGDFYNDYTGSTTSDKGARTAVLSQAATSTNSANSLTIVSRATHIIGYNSATSIILNRNATASNTGQTASIYEGKHGILWWDQGSIENVHVRHFSGIGICIEADMFVAPATNANNFVINRCKSNYNGRHGMYTRGGDSNGGTAMGNCDFTGNRGLGVAEASFLGNVYLGCHTSYNDMGGYASWGNVVNTSLLHCYSEGGMPPSPMMSAGAPTLILEGDHGAGLHGASWHGITGGKIYNLGVTNTTTVTGANCPVILTGMGDPNASASLDPPKGSIYLRNDGGVGTSLYVKSAAGSVGWSAVS